LRRAQVLITIYRNYLSVRGVASVKRVRPLQDTCFVFITVRLRTIPRRVEGPNGRPFRAKAPWRARAREISRRESPRARRASISLTRDSSFWLATNRPQAPVGSRRGRSETRDDPSSGVGRVRLGSSRR